jgi:large subunit ribosomal protein LP0
MAIRKTQTKAEKKQAYDRKLCKFLEEYSRVLIAEVDNVGSTQLAAVRRGIRGDSEMLMGKNTLIRRCIKVHAEATGNDKIKAIIPLLQVSPPPSTTRSCCLFIVFSSNLVLPLLVD